MPSIGGNSLQNSHVRDRHTQNAGLGIQHFVMILESTYRIFLFKLPFCIQWGYRPSLNLGALRCFQEILTGENTVGYDQGRSGGISVPAFI